MRALDSRIWTEVYARAALLSALLILLSLACQRRLAVWTLPAAGLLLCTGPGLLLDLLFPGPGAPPPYFDLLVNISVAGAVLIAIYLTWRSRGKVAVSREAWLILILYLLSSIAQPVGGLMILLSLSLPLSVALPLLQHHGMAAGLLALAGSFWVVDSVWDPSYYLPAGAAKAVELLLPAGLLVLPPLFLLRARTIRGQLSGLVLPPAAALLLCEVIRVATYPPVYSAELWLTRGMGLVQITLLILFATLVYRSASSLPQSPAATPLSP
jgi:hypothetical protein